MSTREAGTHPGPQSGNETAELDGLRPAIVRCLEHLGWNRLLGKARGGSQTLLEHTLSVLDVLQACLPFLATDSFPPLSHDESMGMALAAVAHDAGKAGPDFQAYLRDESPSGGEHVDAERIREVVVMVAASIGFEVGAVLDDIVSGAMLHDRRKRSDRGELAEWERHHVSARWRKLADAVNYADTLASVGDVMAAEDFLRRTPQLIPGASVASYRVRLRGVSTTFLHEAALEVFERSGWRAIVHFAEGTVFAGSGTPRPTAEEVEAALRTRLSMLLDQRKERLPQLAVGSPLQDFLPRPEYVRREGLRDLWAVAAKRARRKKDQKEAERAKLSQQWIVAFPDGPAPTAADFDALRDIGPEACTFKLAKYVFTRVLDDPARARAREKYQERFGIGTFDDLMKQSTLMPIQDYKLCVRGWHALPASSVGEHGCETVGQVDPQRRVDKLIEILVGITETALKDQVDALPSDRLVEDSAGRIMLDLTLDAPLDGRAEADASLAGYSAFKASKRGRGGVLQCSQCAASIGPGTADAASASLGNLGSFSNRRLAFDGSSDAPVCRACTTDLKLGQLSLGKAVQTVIAVVPRRGLGPDGARELVQRARELRNEVDRQLSPETMDPAKYVALSLPVVLLSDRHAPENLSGMLVRSTSADKKKERAKKLEKALAELLDEDALHDLNQTHDTNFQSAADLANALMQQTVPAALRADFDVQSSLAAMAGGQVDFAALTPNFVTIALEGQIGGMDDKDADRALYSFALGALFAFHLDAAVFVGPLRELRVALASRAGRAVYVPANGPARGVLGGDWLDLTSAQRWLAALRAAIGLKGRAGARTLLEVLKYPSAGFVVRRVEQQAKETPFWPELWPHIEALERVLG